MRVLQTLALPLGHDAMLRKLLSGRWDSNPRPSPWQGDVLPLYYARNSGPVSDRECRDPGSNWGHRDFQSRALPTELSRPDILLLSVRDFTRGYRDCQASLFVGRAEAPATQAKRKIRINISLLTFICFHTTIFVYSKKESNADFSRHRRLHITYV